MRRMQCYALGHHRSPSDGLLQTSNVSSVPSNLVPGVRKWLDSRTIHVDVEHMNSNYNSCKSCCLSEVMFHRRLSESRTPKPWTSKNSGVPELASLCVQPLIGHNNWGTVGLLMCKIIVLLMFPTDAVCYNGKIVFSKLQYKLQSHSDCQPAKHISIC